jgi:hypothetical protein
VQHAGFLFEFTTFKSEKGKVKLLSTLGLQAGIGVGKTSARDT